MEKNILQIMTAVLLSTSSLTAFGQAEGRYRNS